MHWRATIAGLACVLAGCAPPVSSAEPLAPIAAERTVDVGATPQIPLTEHFRRTTQIENPCGSFPGALSFGADADMLRVDCLPDPRNAVDDGFDGMVGYVSPPRGAPWRVAVDLENGAELARLNEFTTCSDAFDRLELALGRGRAMFSCYAMRGDNGGGWRVVSDMPGEPAINLTLSYTYRYGFAPVAGALVRQGGTGTAADGMPNPEVAFPFRDHDFVWRPLALSDDGSIDCARSTNTTINGERLLLVAGRNVRQVESNGYAFVRCDRRGTLVIDPETGEATLLPDGAYGDVTATNEVFVDRSGGGQRGGPRTRSTTCGARLAPSSWGSLPAWRLIHAATCALRLWSENGSL